jgi:hypothetical protein
LSDAAITTWCSTHGGSFLRDNKYKK